MKGVSMPLFLWKRSYEIGVAEIDVQHRRLVGFINELSDAMMVKQGHRAVPHVLEELIDYIQLHFTTEEELMQRVKYPALDEHCQEHLEMTKQILQFKARYYREQDLSPSELLGFLCEWLKVHILDSDKEFGGYQRRGAMGLG